MLKYVGLLLKEVYQLKTQTTSVNKIISVHTYTHPVRQSLLFLCITMVVNTLRAHSCTLLIIQPESFKLSLQPYLYVYIMFAKFCPDIFTLKYVELLLNEVYSLRTQTLSVKGKIIPVHAYTHPVRLTIVTFLHITMEVNALRTHSHTSLINQPD